MTETIVHTPIEHVRIGDRISGVDAYGTATLSVTMPFGTRVADVITHDYTVVLVTEGDALSAIRLQGAKEKTIVTVHRTD